jgi:urease beta subunit
MTEIQERRAEGAGRVRVETLVEVCGNEPGIPAFEAEAVDVSARGMHLRTAYLPDNGAPLVCRFEEGGREIVVEGRVAWRREGSRGGEFGVEFTALDSGSVGALRELCDGASEPGAAPEAQQDARSEVGSRVRLHIDGLGSPMKARVRESGSQNVQVGSNLEFLKVGRRLEVEDLEAGGRRQAQIDGVSVAIDPQTRVPQLVVQLRFAGAEDTTPEPSVTALHGGGETAGKGFKIPVSSVTTDAAAEARDNDEDESDDDDEDAAALRGKIGEAAANAGEAVQTASAAVARFSARAAQGMGGLFKGAGLKVLELTKRAEPAPQRRTTAPAPNGNKGDFSQRLRPQSSANVNASEEVAISATKQLTRKKLMLGAGGVVLLATVAAVATHYATPAAPPPGALAAAAPAVANLAPRSTGAPLSASPTGIGASTYGIASANVPLFGPTPMATMEPAPLAPPPGSPEAVEAQEKADAKSNLSGAPVSSAAADEAFSDESSDDDKSDGKSSKDDKNKSEKSSKTDTTPWGHGKLHSPTIYRLRLDAPGGKIQGALLPTGFTVLVPGHKVMEAGGSIAKRDNRISSVRTSNRTEGAEVSFRFRDSIPAYRVRLRRDYIEILIGEAESKDLRDSKAKSSKGEKSDSKLSARAKPHRD